jgi:Domain of unknown function (DUF4129)
MNRFSRPLFLILTVLWVAFRECSVQPAGAAPPVSAEAHHARLQRAEAALRRLEQRAKAPRRPLEGILRGLAKPEVVRRRDGSTQTAGVDEWLRLAKTIKGRPSPSEVRAAREAVVRRRLALEQWMRPRGGSFYQPRDAQSLMHQLEATGQILTGPTRIQQFWAGIKNGFRKTVGEWLRRIVNWLTGSMPSAPAKVPDIDTRWIRFLFYSTVLSLLAVLGYLVWRTLGGRWGRQGARRDVRFAGEDAELLRLPPDELRDRARQLAADGNFREALRHLYIALLLNLDARGVWRYDTRRTNWEHIAALRRKTDDDSSRELLVEPLSDLTLRFDRVRYGNAACDQEDWTRFARDVEQLETAVNG